MATIKPSFAAEASISVTGLNSLADGSAVSSDAVDNTSNLYISANVEVQLVGVSASNTDDCIIALERGIDGSNYEDGPSNTVQNREVIGIVKMNGTSTVRSVFFIQNLGPYFKIRIDNESGAALGSSGNALSYVGIQYTAS